MGSAVLEVTDTGSRRTPTSPTAIIYARTTPRTKRALKIKAAEEGRTMAEVVESAVRLYLKLPGSAAPKMRKHD
jgi:hypothetical protein